MKKLLILLLISVSSLYADSTTREYSLKNGLKILMIEKKSVPIIAFSIWFKCGSKCDSLSKSGAAHFLEHLAFLNHKKEFRNYLEEIGADKNAFTTIDLICFHEIFPKEHLEQILSFEANRIKTLEIEPEVFENEKKSIIEERGMRIESSMTGRYIESFLANIFNRQIGGISVIGWKHEIESITIDDLRDFYTKWLIPNNATIVMVGDFDQSSALQLIEKYFSNIPSSDLPTLFYSDKESVYPNSLSIKSSNNGAIHSIQYTYKVPFLAKDNLRKSLALNLALETLNQQSLFIKGILKQIDNFPVALYFSYIDQTYQYDILTVSFETNSVDNLDMIQLYWRYFKRRILLDYIKEEDLRTIKRKKLIELAFKKEDIEQISDYYGRLFMTGLSLKDIESIDATIQSITAKECNDVLKEVFSLSPINIFKTLPQGYEREQ